MPVPLSPLADSAPLLRRDKVWLALLALIVVGLGVATTFRSAYLSSPKTDFQVYARAAWAVRAGVDPYTVTDDNGWHYIYPPTFAILMAPLADPYPFLPRDGYLPFAFSVGVWYAFGIGCAAYAVHAFASAVLPGLAFGSRRWWTARVVPVVVCLSGIGLTVSRGQVNTVVVALAAAGFAAAVRNRRLASGAWLAAAAVLKIIPGFLLLYPLVRRDGRALVGAVLGGVVLLGAIPAAVWGGSGAVATNRKTVELVLLPIVSTDGDATLKRELHGATATFSQSVQAAVHAWQYRDRATRPDDAGRAAKGAHLVVGGLMLAVALVVARRRLTADPADQLVFFGSLCTLMMLLTPVSHMHYYAFVLPLACGLWLRGLARRPGQIAADRRTTAMLAFWGLATMLPVFPGPFFERLRECGFGTAATLLLWTYAMVVLGRSWPAVVSVPPQPTVHTRAA